MHFLEIPHFTQIYFHNVEKSTVQKKLSWVEFGHFLGIFGIPYVLFNAKLTKKVKLSLARNTYPRLILDVLVVLLVVLVVVVLEVVV